MKQLGTMINNLIKSSGLRLGRRSEYERLAAGITNKQNLLEVVKELQGCFQELIFRDLPSREGRTELLAGLFGTNVSEAMYLIEYLHRSLPLEGDVCEFGVAQGATSALIANEIRETNKHLWLFDSFAGLPAPGEKDQLIDDIFNLGSIEKYEGQMACAQDLVQSKLRDISFPPERVKIFAGFIEETAARPPLPDKVCFAYIDFDFYDPIRLVLEYLDDRLSPGGFLMVDDYGFFSSGAQTAVDEFVGKHGEAYDLILPLKFAGHFSILHKRQ